MTIILPIMLVSILVGLFAPRMTAGWWAFLTVWILLILLYNYLKPPPVPAPITMVIGSSRNA